MKSHRYNQPLPPNPYNPLSWISPGAVIGENCWIGSDVVITANVEIEDNVSISCGVKIYDHDNSWYRVSEGRVESKHYKVKIGRFTQVGSNTVIAPSCSNINIGHHCIVGALSFIRESTPPNCIVVGNPQHVIKYINETAIKERIRRNNEL